MDECWRSDDIGRKPKCQGTGGQSRPPNKEELLARPSLPLHYYWPQVVRRRSRGVSIGIEVNSKNQLPTTEHIVLIHTLTTRTLVLTRVYRNTSVEADNRYCSTAGLFRFAHCSLLRCRDSRSSLLQRSTRSLSLFSTRLSFRTDLSKTLFSFAHRFRPSHRSPYKQAKVEWTVADELSRERHIDRWKLIHVSNTSISLGQCNRKQYPQQYSWLFARVNNLTPRKQDDEDSLHYCSPTALAVVGLRCNVHRSVCE